MYVSLTQILLALMATLYDNGFKGHVQNSSRAFDYPASYRDCRNRTAIAGSLNVNQGSSSARCHNDLSQGLTLMFGLHITCIIAEKLSTVVD